MSKYLIRSWCSINLLKLLSDLIYAVFPFILKFLCVCMCSWILVHLPRLFVSAFCYLFVFICQSCLLQIPSSVSISQGWNHPGQLEIYWSRRSAPHPIHPVWLVTQMYGLRITWWPNLFPTNSRPELTLLIPNITINID